jgi:hypothetical protein
LNLIRIFFVSFENHLDSRTVPINRDFNARKPQHLPTIVLDQPGIYATIYRWLAVLQDIHGISPDIIRHPQPIGDLSDVYRPSILTRFRLLPRERPQSLDGSSLPNRVAVVLRQVTQPRPRYLDRQIHTSRNCTSQTVSDFVSSTFANPLS